MPPPQAHSRMLTLSSSLSCRRLKPPRRVALFASIPEPRCPLHQFTTSGLPIRWGGQGRLHHCVGCLALHAAKEYVMDHHDLPADLETTRTVSPQELLQHLCGYEGGLPEAMWRPLVAAGTTLVPA